MNAVDRPLSQLNPLLRMAVLAGVETAVRLHIRRKDDLDARDNTGLTPLMLAASRDKGGVCSLLLSAGADVALLDPTGRNALEIAFEAGAKLAVAAIEPYISKKHEVPTDGGVAGERGAAVGEGHGAYATFGIRNAELEDVEFDLSGWEAEEEDVAPHGDETLTGTAAAINRSISVHEPIDDSEGWDDVDAFLPDRAVPLPKADDEERRGPLREMVLRAIREGSVPEATVSAVCVDNHGLPNEEGEAVVRVLLADLGAETDERIEEGQVRFGAASHDEEASVAEALGFLDDLASGRNEPFRHYAREMRSRKLLTAAEEVSLGRAMEEGTSAALRALAAWPNGVAAVLAAAERVKAGELDVEDVSAGKEPASHDEGGAEVVPDLPEDESDEGALDSLSPVVRDFLERIDSIRSLAVHSGMGGAGEEALGDALALARLTAGFLADLADGFGARESGAAARFRKAVNQYASARERMITSNLRLAMSVAKRYMGRGLPIDDLVQEGNIGLMRAVERYDWRKGFRFSTYATWWIRQQVTRAIAIQGKTIRTPVHVHEAMFRIGREVDEVERTTGRRPSTNDLAAKLLMQPRRVTALLARMEEPVALHEPNGDDPAPQDIVIDYHSPDPFESVVYENLRRTLSGILLGLDAKTAEVLTLRFGLDGDGERTLAETGDHFGVTRERARQIECKGLKWLRSPARAEILRDFLDEVPGEMSGTPPSGDVQTGAVRNDGADSPSRGLPGPDSGTCPVPAVQLSLGPLEKLVSLAKESGATVEDDRSTGGHLMVRIRGAVDTKKRRLARALISAGFAHWPGVGYWR